jgi:flagellar hook-associated protein 3 FlgL
MMAREAVTGIQAQMRALDEARRQATTGIRVSRPSDDPVAVAGVMQSSSGLRALEQYQRNLMSAQSRLDVEDSTLSQLTDVMQRAKELAVSQVTSTADASTRAVTAAEVSQLVDFVKGLANTQLAGSYIYGGMYADTPPYVAGALDPAKPPQGAFRVEVGANRLLETNHSAQEIFVDSDAVDSLQALADALNTSDVAGIKSAMSRLDAAYDTVQTVTGDLGARMNQLDVTVSNLESLEVNLQTFRSGLEDADLTEAVTRMVNRQNSLEAAMLANSKILDLTLADYLR